MTLKEAKQKYPDEWVLLANPARDETSQIKDGEMIWHGKNKEELYEQVGDSAFSKMALIYTGDIPTETFFMF